MKRVLTILLTIPAALVLLTGCGTDSSSSDSEKAAEASSSEEISEEKDCCKEKETKDCCKDKEETADVPDCCGG